jgi:outer membrane protein TolC
MRRAWRPLAAIASLAAGTLVAAPAQAENLADAWRMAEEHDYRIGASAADIESARAAEEAARGARLPSLSASGGYSRFDTAPQFQFAFGGSALQAPIFPGDDFTSAGVELKLPVYTGGRISKGIAAASQATAAATEAGRVERTSLRLDVAQAYIDLLRTRRLLQTAESSVASLTAHASDVSSMVERELVARSDFLAARVAQANAEQVRVRAENAVALAEAAYNRRLGEPLERKPAIDPTLPPASIDAGDSPDRLVEEALQRRGEILALSARAEALKLQSEAERAALLPQVAVSGGYTYLDNEILDRKDFSMVGVGVSWSLYDGGQARSRSASLRAASRAAQNRLADLRTLIELEVRQAWLDVREARARVAAAADAVAQADENLRISRELYGSGLGTNTQVLDAIALQVTATNNRDNAALDEILALYRLSHATGAL